MFYYLEVLAHMKYKFIDRTEFNSIRDKVKSDLKVVYITNTVKKRVYSIL